MLLDMQVRIVGGATARGSGTIYTVGGRTPGHDDALAVLERGGRVRAHDVAQVRGHVGGADL